jgi:hypothetical protein
MKTLILDEPLRLPWIKRGHHDHVAGKVIWNRTLQRQNKRHHVLAHHANATRRVEPSFISTSPS